VDSILLLLKDSLIKSDGKMYKVTLRDEEEEKVIRKLADYLRDYINHRISEIYLPLAWPLRGFGGLRILTSRAKTSSEVYAILRELITEFAELSEPIFTSIESIKKCMSVAREILGDETRALDFVRKYLSINRWLFKEILGVLEEGRIFGTIECMERLVMGRIDYEEAYVECRKIRLGENKNDTIAKRIQGIARFFDNLLIIVGAASHEPHSLGEKRFGRGRRHSYTLLPTPFTSALRYVLNTPSKIGDYIEAYNEFIRRTVDSFMKRIEPITATSIISSYLRDYRHINIDLRKERVITAVRVLWRLLEVLERRI